MLSINMFQKKMKITCFDHHVNVVAVVADGLINTDVWEAETEIFQKLNQVVASHHQQILHRPETSCRVAEAFSSKHSF